METETLRASSKNEMESQPGAQEENEPPTEDQTITKLLQMGFSEDKVWVNQMELW